LVRDRARSLIPMTYSLSRGDYACTIHPQGASLLSLQFQGAEFIPKCPNLDPAKSYHGSVIAPWPNRVRDGRYTYRGQEFQLEINEASTGNALHGFSAEATWDCKSLAEDSVTLETVVGGTSGYPWKVGLEAFYQLGSTGLNLTLLATNLSHDSAPFGWAFHPYFLIPGASPSSLMLRTSAKNVVMPDNDRLLPFVEKHVARTPYDFRELRTAELPFLDHAFTEFDWDRNGYSAAEVCEEAGPRLKIVWDSTMPWLQIHRPLSPDLQPALVVEPMSCPPDALNSGRDLIQLESGEEVRSHIHMRVSPS